MENLSNSKETLLSKRMGWGRGWLWALTHLTINALITAVKDNRILFCGRASLPYIPRRKCIFLKFEGSDFYDFNGNSNKI